MHPQLIPERHPKCGKVMEALMRCRKENPIRQYWGVCTDITYQLTKCLKEEKEEFRAPRQAEFHAKYKAKRAADAARMEQLQKEAAERAAAKAAAAAAAAASGGPEAAGPSPTAASVSEPSAPSLSARVAGAWDSVMHHSIQADVVCGRGAAQHAVATDVSQQACKDSNA